MQYRKYNGFNVLPTAGDKYISPRPAVAFIRTVLQMQARQWPAKSGEEESAMEGLESQSFPFIRSQELELG